VGGTDTVVQLRQQVRRDWLDAEHCDGSRALWHPRERGVPGNLLDSPMWQGTLFEQYPASGLVGGCHPPLLRGAGSAGSRCAYDDVANLVVFLASDEASYITGEAYRVAGRQL
jgi:NAD(P)-dependent dehydrogenase (short-subunit alcohol dehydrogenase family)